jgi:phosphomethylpyrimidine synthase
VTRIELAKKGTVTDEVKAAASAENVTAEQLSEDIANGLSVIPLNVNAPKRGARPMAIGRGLTTKINANIGTSKDRASLDEEKEKLEVLLKYGADAVMELSTGGRIRDFRKYILENAPIPLGTVPIYEAAIGAAEKHGSISKMTADDIFAVIEEQAKDGVDFVTVHSGLTLKAVERLRQQGRVLDIVSRGGAFLLEWMVYNERENPLFEQYDRLLELAKKYDLTLSLGDGLRPGCLADATDRAQLEELLTLGELRDRALETGVQVIIEGPGHVPINQVELNIKIQKEVCNGAPFYVLGPLVTDCGMGYDHISGAIGGAIAGAAGADFLCYVTPAEHIKLPSVEDVKEGVIASKIAAHAADIAKGVPSAKERDLKMSRARPPTDSEVCSMCGEFCAIRTVEQALKKK